MKAPLKTTILLLSCTLVSTAVVWTLLAATTRPVFTVGKEATLIEGPLNADGTINYTEAINALLGEGVTRENNAGVLLVEALGTSMDEVTLELWKLSPLPQEQQLVYVHRFASRQKELTVDEQKSLDSAFESCRETPWNEHPILTPWLQQSQRCLDIVEAACARDRCFFPLVSEKSPPEALDAMPFSLIGATRLASETLLVRAMQAAGAGEFDKALADIHRARQLARFVAQQQTDIALLGAVFMEARALRSCAGMATHAGLTPNQLQRLRQEIESLPALPAGDPRRRQVEQMLLLDMLMMCIRGDSARVLQLLGSPLDPQAVVDPGDFARMDWNLLLRAVNRTFLEAHRITELPLDQQAPAFDRLLEAAIREKVPGGLGGDGLAEGKEVLNDFLKRRPGETPEAFADRLARWLVLGNPALSKRMARIVVRGSLDRPIALLVLRLAAHKSAHGAYPDRLADLGGDPLLDPLSGRELLYRRQQQGFVLYSVGINGNDDGGTGDDQPIRAPR